MITLVETPLQLFQANPRELVPPRDERTIPAALDAFMVSYPTDACAHFSTYTIEVGRMFWNQGPDDDIREVEVCHDCGEWVLDPHEGREYPTPEPVMEGDDG